MRELKKKRTRNWLGHWLRRNSLKDVLEGMVKEEESSRQKKISDDR